MGLQVWLAPQHEVQPQRVSPEPHSGTQVLPLRILPQGQVTFLQTPLEQYCPAEQAPVLQIPPQPSEAPQALLVQLGAHLQTPLEQA